MPDKPSDLVQGTLDMLILNWPLRASFLRRKVARYPTPNCMT